MAAAAAMTETIVSLALIVSVLAAVGLRLSAASDESRQSARLVVVAGLWLVRLMLSAIMLLIAWREWLRVPRQIGLPLRLRLRGIARLILAGEWLAIILVVISLITAGLRTRSRLRLLAVIGVLLTELLLRRSDQAEIMLGVLIIIFGRDRIAGALCIARELNIFFRDMRGGASDFYVRSVGFIDPCQRILTFAVPTIVAPPHALLTVSHDVPVRPPFTLSWRLTPIVHLQVLSNSKFLTESNPTKPIHTRPVARTNIDVPRQ